MDKLRRPGLSPGDDEDGEERRNPSRAKKCIEPEATALGRLVTQADLAFGNVKVATRAIADYLHATGWSSSLVDSGRNVLVKKRSKDDVTALLVDLSDLIIGLSAAAAEEEDEPGARTIGAARKNPQFKFRKLGDDEADDDEEEEDDAN